MQQATLCQEHSEELWEAINPLLQTNRAWYRIDKPGVITGKTMTLTNQELIQTLQERLCPTEQATQTKPPLEEIPPCPVIKDWGKKELIMFAIIVGFWFFRFYSIWKPSP